MYLGKVLSGCDLRNTKDTKILSSMRPVPVHKLSVLSYPFLFKRKVVHSSSRSQNLAFLLTLNVSTCF